MIHIYQLGDLTLHLHHQVDGGYEHKGRMRTTEMMWSPRNARPDGQYLMSLRTKTIEGALFGNCAQRAQEYHQRLLTMTDQPIDIIGYVILDGQGQACGDCSCACCMCCDGCTLIWLHNRGAVKTPQLNDDPTNQFPELSIDIEFDSYWQPVNRFLWHWRADKFSPFKVHEVESPYLAGLEGYPTCENLFAGCTPCRVFAKRIFDDCNVLLDPLLHKADFENHMPGYPQIGYAREWTAGTQEYKVFVRRDLWGAPPQSFYVFRNLPQTGTVTIQVQHPRGSWSALTDVAELDLADFHATLVAKGFLGLFPTDRIYVGDVERQPGFLLRNNTIIDIPRPRILHEGFWAGMLEPGENRVKLHLPANAESASVHRFRRM